MGAAAAPLRSYGPSESPAHAGKKSDGHFFRPAFFSRCLSRACLGKRPLLHLIHGTKDTFSQLSLCLSRACLGEIITFMYKWLKQMGLDLLSWSIMSIVSIMSIMSCLSSASQSHLLLALRVAKSLLVRCSEGRRGRHAQRSGILRETPAVSFRCYSCGGFLTLVPSLSWQMIIGFSERRKRSPAFRAPRAQSSAARVAPCAPGGSAWRRSPQASQRSCRPAVLQREIFSARASPARPRPGSGRF
jgi:hypothetical protein